MVGKCKCLFLYSQLAWRCLTATGTCCYNIICLITINQCTGVVSVSIVVDNTKCRQTFGYYQPFCRDASVTKTSWHTILATYHYKSSHVCIHRTHMNAGMNNRIPWKAGNYLTTWGFAPQQETLSNTEAVLIQTCKLRSFNVVSGPVLVLCVVALCNIVVLWHCGNVQYCVIVVLCNIVALCNIVDGYHGIVEVHCLHHQNVP